MTFRDLKLPKEFNKKKKLDLYKCYILEPLAKGAPSRNLDVNLDRERYALTEKGAIEYALNQMGSQEALALIMDDTRFHKTFFVIMTVTLHNGIMDEPPLLSQEGDYEVDLDPQYDPDRGLLTVSISDRYDEMHFKNYNVQDIFFELESGSELIRINDIKLDEVVINSAVTGGK